jgi:hypothetical protein
MSQWDYQHITLASSPAGDNTGNDTAGNFTNRFGTNLVFPPKSEIDLTAARIDFGPLTVEWPAGAALKIDCSDDGDQSFEDTTIVLSKGSERLNPFDFAAQMSNLIAVGIQQNFTGANRTVEVRLSYSYESGFSFDYKLPNTDSSILLNFNSTGVNLAPVLGFVSAAYVRRGQLNGSIESDSRVPLNPVIKPAAGGLQASYYNTGVNVELVNLPLDNFYAVANPLTPNVPSVGQPAIVRTLALPEFPDTILRWEAKTQNWFSLHNSNRIEVNNLQARLTNIAGSVYACVDPTVLVMTIRSPRRSDSNTEHCGCN